MSAIPRLHPSLDAAPTPAQEGQELSVVGRDAVRLLTTVAPEEPDRHSSSGIAFQHPPHRSEGLSSLQGTDMVLVVHWLVPARFAVLGRPSPGPDGRRQALLDSMSPVLSPSQVAPVEPRGTREHEGRLAPGGPMAPQQGIVNREGEAYGGPPRPQSPVVGVPARPSRSMSSAESVSSTPRSSLPPRRKPCHRNAATGATRLVGAEWSLAIP